MKLRIITLICFLSFSCLSAISQTVNETPSESPDSSNKISNPIQQTKELQEPKPSITPNTNKSEEKNALPEEEFNLKEESEAAPGTISPGTSEPVPGAEILIDPAVQETPGQPNQNQNNSSISTEKKKNKDKKKTAPVPSPSN